MVYKRCFMSHTPHPYTSSRKSIFEESKIFGTVNNGTKIPVLIQNFIENHREEVKTMSNRFSGSFWRLLFINLRILFRFLLNLDVSETKNINPEYANLID